MCVFKNMTEHNIAALLDAGLCVTVNSDDPAYFGGYMNQNLIGTFEALPELSARATPTNWPPTASRRALRPQADKAQWRVALDAVFAAA